MTPPRLDADIVVARLTLISRSLDEYRDYVREIAAYTRSRSS